VMLVGNDHQALGPRETLTVSIPQRTAIAPSASASFNELRKHYGTLS
jgi:hypothetical protein